MNTNQILKILGSLPVILLFLYFIPFVGICLIILRYCVYGKNKYFSIPIDLIIIGLIIIVPKVFNIGLNLLNSKINVLDEMIESDIYLKLMDYSKYIITVGIVFLIISIIFRKIFDKINSLITRFALAEINANAKISKENDMEIKLKQEKAKNTNVVYCPNCGADNILSENVGVCKYCRNPLQQKL